MAASKPISDATIKLFSDIFRFILPNTTAENKEALAPGELGIDYNTGVFYFRDPTTLEIRTPNSVEAFQFIETRWNASTNELSADLVGGLKVYSSVTHIPDITDINTVTIDTMIAKMKAPSILYAETKTDSYEAVGLPSSHGVLTIVKMGETSVTLQYTDMVKLIDYLGQFDVATRQFVYWLRDEDTMTNYAVATGNGLAQTVNSTNPVEDLLTLKVKLTNDVQPTALWTINNTTASVLYNIDGTALSSGLLKQGSVITLIRDAISSKWILIDMTKSVYDARMQLLYQRIVAVTTAVDVQTTIDAANAAAASAQAAAAHDIVLQTGLTAVQQLAARSNIDAQKQAWETTAGHIATCTDANAGTCYPMIYGKSVQDGTPTPEAPVAMQSVQTPLFVEISQTFSNAYIIQDAIRKGTIKNYVSVGDFFTVGRGGTDWLFQVAAFDYDVPVKAQYTHSMRLLMYPCFASVAFDAQEAIYYAAAELAAGTYWFLDSRTNKYCSFTTTLAIPLGGQAVPTYGASPDYAITTIKTYASQTATTAIETATVTISDTAPITGTQLTPVNDGSRARFGSNNWMQSAIRQWLNSAATTGWWTAKNIYDRPQPYPTDGFLNGIDADLLACIGKVRLRTGLNPVDNAGTFGYSDNEELIFLPSRTEMGLGNSATDIYETPVAADGTAKTDVLPLFKSNADRIKYLAGVARYWWMRSPGPTAAGAGGAYVVYLGGSLDYSYALYGSGAVPACVIY